MAKDVNKVQIEKLFKEVEEGNIEILDTQKAIGNSLADFIVKGRSVGYGIYNEIAGYGTEMVQIPDADEIQLDIQKIGSDIVYVDSIKDKVKQLINLCEESREVDTQQLKIFSKQLSDMSDARGSLKNYLNQILNDLEKNENVGSSGGGGGNEDSGGGGGGNDTSHVSVADALSTVKEGENADENAVGNAKAAAESAMKGISLNGESLGLSYFSQDSDGSSDDVNLPEPDVLVQAIAKVQDAITTMENRVTTLKAEIVAMQEANKKLALVPKLRGSGEFWTDEKGVKHERMEPNEPEYSLAQEQIDANNTAIENNQKEIEQLSGPGGDISRAKSDLGKLNSIYNAMNRAASGNLDLYVTSKLLGDGMEYDDEGKLAGLKIGDRHYDSVESAEIFSKLKDVLGNGNYSLLQGNRTDDYKGNSFFESDLNNLLSACSGAAVTFKGISSFNLSGGNHSYTSDQVNTIKGWEHDVEEMAKQEFANGDDYDVIYFDTVAGIKTGNWDPDDAEGLSKYIDFSREAIHAYAENEDHLFDLEDENGIGLLDIKWSSILSSDLGKRRDNEVVKLAEEGYIEILVDENGKPILGENNEYQYAVSSSDNINEIIIEAIGTMHDYNSRIESLDKEYIENVGIALGVDENGDVNLGKLSPCDYKTIPGVGLVDANGNPVNDEVILTPEGIIDKSINPNDPDKPNFNDRYFQALQYYQSFGNDLRNAYNSNILYSDLNDILQAHISLSLTDFNATFTHPDSMNVDMDAEYAKYQEEKAQQPFSKLEDNLPLLFTDHSEDIKALDEKIHKVCETYINALEDGLVAVSNIDVLSSAIYSSVMAGLNYNDSTYMSQVGANDQMIVDFKQQYDEKQAELLEIAKTEQGLKGDAALAWAAKELEKWATYNNVNDRIDLINSNKAILDESDELVGKLQERMDNINPYLNDYNQQYNYLTLFDSIGQALVTNDTLRERNNEHTLSMLNEATYIDECLKKVKETAYSLEKLEAILGTSFDILLDNSQLTESRIATQDRYCGRWLDFIHEWNINNDNPECVFNEEQIGAIIDRAANWESQKNFELVHWGELNDKLMISYEKKVHDDLYDTYLDEYLREEFDKRYNKTSPMEYAESITNYETKVSKDGKTTSYYSEGTLFKEVTVNDDGTQTVTVFNDEFDTAQYVINSDGSIEVLFDEVEKAFNDFKANPPIAQRGIDKVIEERIAEILKNDSMYSYFKDNKTDEITDKIEETNTTLVELAKGHPKWDSWSKQLEGIADCNIAYEATGEIDYSYYGAARPKKEKTIHFYDDTGSEINVSPELAALYMYQHPDKAKELSGLFRFDVATDNFYKMCDKYYAFGSKNFDTSALSAVSFFGNSFAQSKDIFGNSFYNYSQNDYITARIDYLINTARKAEAFDKVAWRTDLYNFLKDNNLYLSYTSFVLLDSVIVEGIAGQFWSGTKDFFANYHSDYTTVREFKNQMMNDWFYENDPFMKYVYEFGSVTGNMLPSMFASAVTGIPLLGSALMFVSSAGNYEVEALRNGMTAEQAEMYGVISGLSEVILEKVLGSVPGLSNMEKFAKLPGMSGLLAKMFSEGLEEGVQDVLSPFFEGLSRNGLIPHRGIDGAIQFFSDENGNRIDPWDVLKQVDLNQVVHSFVMGALSGGFMGGGSNVVQSYSFMKYGSYDAISKAIKQNRIVTAESIQNADNIFKKWSMMYQFVKDTPSAISKANEYLTTELRETINDTAGKIAALSEVAEEYNNIKDKLHMSYDQFCRELAVDALFNSQSQTNSAQSKIESLKQQLDERQQQLSNMRNELVQKQLQLDSGTITEYAEKVKITNEINELSKEIDTLEKNIDKINDNIKKAEEVVSKNNLDEINELTPNLVKGIMEFEGKYLEEEKPSLYNRIKSFFKGENTVQTPTELYKHIKELQKQSLAKRDELQQLVDKGKANTKQISLLEAINKDIKEYDEKINELEAKFKEQNIDINKVLELQQKIDERIADISKITSELDNTDSDTVRMIKEKIIEQNVQLIKQMKNELAVMDSTVDVSELIEQNNNRKTLWDLLDKVFDKSKAPAKLDHIDSDLINDYIDILSQLADLEEVKGLMGTLDASAITAKISELTVEANKIRELIDKDNVDINKTLQQHNRYDVLNAIAKNLSLIGQTQAASIMSTQHLSPNDLQMKGRTNNRLINNKYNRQNNINRRKRRIVNDDYIIANANETIVGEVKADNGSLIRYTIHDGNQITINSKNVFINNIINSIEDAIFEGHDTIEGIPIYDALQVIANIQQNGREVKISKNVQKVVDIIKTLNNGDILLNYSGVLAGDNAIILSSETVDNYITKYGRNEFNNFIKNLNINSTLVSTDMQILLDLAKNNPQLYNYVSESNLADLIINNNDSIDINQIFSELNINKKNALVNELIKTDSNKFVESIIASLNDNNIKGVITIENIGSLSNEQIKKIKETHAEIIDEIVNNKDNLIKFLAENSDNVLFDRLNKIEENSELFGNISKADLIKELYDYIMNNKHLLNDIRKVDNYLEIKELKDMILNNKESLNEVQKFKNLDLTSVISEIKNRNAIDKLSPLFKRYAEGVLKGEIAIDDVYSYDVIEYYVHADETLKSDFDINIVKEIIKNSDIISKMLDSKLLNINSEGIITFDTKSISKVEANDMLNCIKCLNEIAKYNTINDIMIKEQLDTYNKVSPFLNNELSKVVDNVSSLVNQHIIADIMTSSDYNMQVIKEKLISQVQSKYPGISKAEATKFLYSMEAVNDSIGICNFADVANAIFESYINDVNGAERFRKIFGFELYVDGKLNQAELLVDMLSTITGDKLITKNENGEYVAASSNKGYIHLTEVLESARTYNTDLIAQYLLDKGIRFEDINIGETRLYDTRNQKFKASEYRTIRDKIISEITNSLQRGEHISISSDRGLLMYDLELGRNVKLSEGHIMTIYGIDSQGRLLVDTGGKKYAIDVEMAMRNNTGFTIDSLTVKVDRNAQINPQSKRTQIVDFSSYVNQKGKIAAGKIEINARNITEEVTIINPSSLDMNTDRFSKKSFNHNKSYQKYDRVIKTNNSLMDALNSINENNLSGNILIELNDTTGLTQEAIDKIPDNVSIRILGAYTESYIYSFRNVDDVYYLLDKATYSKQELQQIYDVITTIESGIDPTWSKYEKAKYIYDYLTNEENVKYIPNPDGGNRNRPKQFDGLMSLVRKESTCNGFAHTYQALLQRQGIECYSLSGRFNETRTNLISRNSHAFNVVIIDGNTFLVDTVRQHQGIYSEGTGFGVKLDKIYQYNIANNQVVNDTSFNAEANADGTIVNVDNIERNAKAPVGELLDEDGEYLNDLEVKEQSKWHKFLDSILKIPSKEQFETIANNGLFNNEKTSVGLDVTKQSPDNIRALKRAEFFFDFDNRAKQLIANSGNLGRAELLGVIEDVDSYFYRMTKNTKFETMYPYIEAKIAEIKNEIAKCNDAKSLNKFREKYIYGFTQEAADAVSNSILADGFLEFYENQFKDAIDKCNSLNELLHAIHYAALNMSVESSYDGGQIPVLYDGLTMIKEGNTTFEGIIEYNKKGKPIYGYDVIRAFGKDSKLLDSIFDSLNKKVDSGRIDILSLGDKLLLTVRGSGHYLTIELSQLSDGNIEVSYQFPKVININKVNNIKGIQKVDINSQFATGGFITKENEIGTEIRNLIESVPTDNDLFTEGGRLDSSVERNARNITEDITSLKERAYELQKEISNLSSNPNSSEFINAMNEFQDIMMKMIEINETEIGSSERNARNITEDITSLKERAYELQKEISNLSSNPNSSEFINAMNEFQDIMMKMIEINETEIGSSERNARVTEYKPVDVISYVDNGINNGTMKPSEVTKVSRIEARQGTIGEKVSTILADGTVEVESREVTVDPETGEPGWIVKNVNSPEQWIVSDSKFKKKYELDTENAKDNVYKPKGGKMLAVEVTENIEITPPNWGGEKQVINKGGYLLIDPNNTRDIYGIGRDEFNNTYKFTSNDNLGTERNARNPIANIVDNNSYMDKFDTSGATDVHYEYIGHIRIDIPLSRNITFSVLLKDNKTRIYKLRDTNANGYAKHMIDSVKRCFSDNNVLVYKDSQQKMFINLLKSSGIITLNKKGTYTLNADIGIPKSTGMSDYSDYEQIITKFVNHTLKKSEKIDYEIGEADKICELATYAVKMIYSRALENYALGNYKQSLWKSFHKGGSNVYVNGAVEGSPYFIEVIGFKDGNSTYIKHLFAETEAKNTDLKSTPISELEYTIQKVFMSWFISENESESFRFASVADNISDLCNEINKALEYEICDNSSGKNYKNDSNLQEAARIMINKLTSRLEDILNDSSNTGKIKQLVDYVRNITKKTLSKENDTGNIAGTSNPKPLKDLLDLRGNEMPSERLLQLLMTEELDGIEKSKALLAIKTDFKESTGVENIYKTKLQSIKDTTDHFDARLLDKYHDFVRDLIKNNKNISYEELVDAIINELRNDYSLSLTYSTKDINNLQLLIRWFAEDSTSDKITEINRIFNIQKALCKSMRTIDAALDDANMTSLSANVVETLKKCFIRQALNTSNNTTSYLTEPFFEMILNEVYNDGSLASQGTETDVMATFDAVRRWFSQTEWWNSSQETKLNDTQNKLLKEMRLLDEFDNQIDARIEGSTAPKSVIERLKSIFANEYIDADSTYDTYFNTDIFEKMLTEVFECNLTNEADMLATTDLIRKWFSQSEWWNEIDGEEYLADIENTYKKHFTVKHTFTTVINEILSRASEITNNSLKNRLMELHTLFDKLQDVYLNTQDLKLSDNNYFQKMKDKLTEMIPDGMYYDAADILDIIFTNEDANTLLHDKLDELVSYDGPNTSNNNQVTERNARNITEDITSLKERAYELQKEISNLRSNPNSPEFIKAMNEFQDIMMKMIEINETEIGSNERNARNITEDITSLKERAYELQKEISNLRSNPNSPEFIKAMNEFQDIMTKMIEINETEIGSNERNAKGGFIEVSSKINSILKQDEINYNEIANIINSQPLNLRNELIDLLGDKIEYIYDKISPDVLVDYLGNGNISLNDSLWNNDNLIKNIYKLLENEEYFNLIKDRANNLDFARNFGSICIKHDSYSLTLMKNLLTIPNLTSYFCQDSYFSYLFKIFIDNSNYDSFADNILVNIDINKMHEYIGLKTLDKLSETDRLKFEERFPGVIDKVINKSGQLTAKDIIDSYSMLDNFIDFDNHKLLFRNLSKEYYIDMLYDYIISEENLSKTNKYDILKPEFFKIDGIKERLLENDKILALLNEVGTNSFCELLNDDAIYDKVDKDSLLFQSYSSEVLKGKVELRIDHLRDIINSFEKQYHLSYDTIDFKVTKQIYEYIKENKYELISKMRHNESLSKSEVDELINYYKTFKLLTTYTKYDDAVQYAALDNIINKIDGMLQDKDGSLHDNIDNDTISYDEMMSDMETISLDIINNENIYQNIDKLSKSFDLYANDVLSGKIEFRLDRITDIINSYLNNSNRSDISTIVLAKLKEYVNSSRIIDRFNSNHDNFTKNDIQELIDYISARNLIEENINLDSQLSLDKINEIYNFINKSLLENNTLIDNSHLQAQLYNFTKYYAKLNEIKLYVKFYYEDSSTGGYSYGGSVGYNTKFFNEKFKTDNYYLDKLEVIFHEIFHETQHQEKALVNVEIESGEFHGAVNKYSLIQTIDDILRDKANDYYKHNYTTIQSEIDARYNSHIFLSEYVKEISPKVYEEYKERFNSIIRSTIKENHKLSDKDLFNVNINGMRYEEKYLSRDAVLERIVMNDSNILEEEPILKFIFNKDGTRKNISELFETIKEYNNSFITDMINHWIKTSSYSIVSMIQELCESCKSELRGQELYDNIIERLTSIKFGETMLLESDYFTDNSFRINLEECIDMLVSDVQDIDSISFKNNILRQYDALYNEFADNQFEYILSLKNIHILANYINNNITNTSLVKEIISKCDYDTWGSLVFDRMLPKDVMIPLLMERTEYVKTYFDEFFDADFDYIRIRILDFIPVNQLHKYITFEQINMLSEKNRANFEKNYPGVIEKITSSESQNNTVRNAKAPVEEILDENGEYLNNSEIKAQSKWYKLLDSILTPSKEQFEKNAKAQIEEITSADHSIKDKIKSFLSTKSNDSLGKITINDRNSDYLLTPRYESNTGVKYNLLDIIKILNKDISYRNDGSANNFRDSFAHNELMDNKESLGISMDQVLDDIINLKNDGIDITLSSNIEELIKVKTGLKDGDILLNSFDVYNGTEAVIVHGDGTITVGGKAVDIDNIFNKFTINPDKLSRKELGNLCDALKVYELLVDNKLGDNINLDEDTLFEMYKYINIGFIYSNTLNVKSMRNFIYAFTKYFARINGLNVQVEFYEGQRNDYGYSDRGIIGFNGNIAVVNPNSFYIDTLNTIFHEVFHEFQHAETDSNKYTLGNTIDRLLKSNRLEYYGENYNTIFFEIDARYNAAAMTLNYLEMIDSTLYQRYLEKYMSELNVEFANYEKNLNKYEISELSLNRDAALENIIKNNPELLQRNLTLKYIFNPDGTRKTLYELAEVIKNNADNNHVVDMINYWVRTSEYSLESITREYFELYKNGFDSLPDEFIQIVKNSLDSKLANTILLESNNLENVKLFDKINEYVKDYNIDTLQSGVTIDEFLSDMHAKVDKIYEDLAKSKENVKKNNNIKDRLFNQDVNNRGMFNARLNNSFHDGSPIDVINAQLVDSENQFSEINNENTNKDTNISSNTERNASISTIDDSPTLTERNASASAFNNSNAYNYEITYNGARYNLGKLIFTFQSYVDMYGIAFMRTNQYLNGYMNEFLEVLVEAYNKGISVEVDNNIKIVLSAINYANQNGLKLLNYADVYLGKQPVFISNSFISKYGNNFVTSVMDAINSNTRSLTENEIIFMLELSEENIEAIKYVPIDYLFDNIKKIKIKYHNINKAIMKHDTRAVSVLGEDVVSKLKNNSPKIDSEKTANMKLRDEILSNVKGITNPAALARAIYIELNKRVHYDYTYHWGNKEMAMQKAQDKVLRNKGINVEHELICIEWANLYRELLIEAGFNAKDVQIEGDFNEHQWVSIRLNDNYYIIADGTNAYNKVSNPDIDIERAKVGKPMLEFLIVGPEYKGRLINSIFDEWKAKSYDIEATIYENKYLKTIDEQIGYTKDHTYISQKLAAADKQFGAVGRNIHNELSKMSTVGRIESIFEMKLPLEMSGHEAIKYYEMIFSKFGLRKNIDYKWKLYWNNANDIEPICVIEYKDIYGNMKYFVYSQQRGKKFMNYQELMELYKELNVAKEWRSDH